MKITHQTTTIDQVKQGECFRVENIYYMATGTYLYEKRRCVCLYTGDLEEFNNNAVVTPVEAEVVVRS